MTDDELIGSVRKFTLTSPERLQAMVGALRLIDSHCIAGDVVECGVWRGGNMMLARMLSPERVCWLYDTFTGMTEPEEIDVPAKGGLSALGKYRDKQTSGEPWCAASEDDVRNGFDHLGLLDTEKLRFVKGDICETLYDQANLPDKIALLRLDTDWYASTKAELEVLYPRLQPGGVLIVDDYGHWEGARMAVDEYFDDTAAFTQIDYTGVMMVKPC